MDLYSAIDVSQRCLGCWYRHDMFCDPSDILDGLWRTSRSERYLGLLFGGKTLKTEIS